MNATSDRPRLSDVGPARPSPQYCTVGEMLCEVRLWSEDEWDAMPSGDRPEVVSHVLGLGWVGAVPSRIHLVIGPT